MWGAFYGMSRVQSESKYLRALLEGPVFPPNGSPPEVLPLQTPPPPNPAFLDLFLIPYYYSQMPLV